MDEPARAARAVARAARVARVSACILIVLAGLSTALNAREPRNVHFLISVIVLGNGLMEWRLARQLARGHAQAPARLALNQGALGFAILAFSAWQIFTFSPEQIQALLDDPALRPYVEAVPPEQLREILEQFPPVYIGVVATVGLITAAGCGALAWYYLSRRKHLPLLPAAAER